MSSSAARACSNHARAGHPDPTTPGRSNTMGHIARTPYCHKIRYGITGVPTLTEDEMDGSHAPGIGVTPTLIELVYSVARDDKPASVAASVTGDWTRFGERADGQVAVHFTDGPDGWPAWLAEEVRLHNPDASSAGVAPVADQAALRARLVSALDTAFQTFVSPLSDAGVGLELSEHLADAVLSVLPAPADRAATEERAARWETAALKAGREVDRNALRVYMAVADAEQAELRRLADEAQQPSADPSWPRRAWDLGLLHKGGDPHHCPACVAQPEPPKDFICPGAEANAEVLANPQPAVEAQQPTQRNIQCPDAFWRPRPHAPHNWQQAPDTQPVHCPGVADTQQPKEA